MYDIIIKNGEIMDGSGEKSYKADVAIYRDKIIKIGILKDEQAKTVLNAEDLIIAPGFIDALSHSDTYFTLFNAPSQESMISQGVTTLMGGNCGYSLAPLTSSRTLDSERHWTDRRTSINIDWLRMSEFLENMGNKKLAVNFGTLVGYNTIARGVLNDSYRDINQKENEIVTSLVSQALTEGAFGLSLGLAYLHHNGTHMESFDGLFKIAGEHRKVVTVHLKDEGDNFIDSLNLVLKLAKNNQTPIHISHLRVTREDSWMSFRKAIRLIEQAAKNDVKISFDVFPYASSSLALYLLLPHWAKKNGADMIIKRLNNSYERKQIVKDLKEIKLDYAKMTAASLAPDIFIGKTLKEIADNMGENGEEALCELLIASKLQATVFTHTIDEAALEMAIAHPLSIIASSGAGYNIAQHVPLSSDLPHPRSFGTFPRLLSKYALDEKIISPETAISKITNQPARIFGISERGLIKEGYFADIVVFDPKSIKDKATFQNPFQYSQGIVSVMVNGMPVYKNGRFIKNRPGAILRRKP